MGINANGKHNYIRKINDAYSVSFSIPYLNSIKLDKGGRQEIQNYLLNQTIKGVVIGITYINNFFQVDNIEENGYYSLYFYSDEKNRYNHGIVLELSKEKRFENQNHIFEYKNKSGYLIYYGLDYDQYLFQRGSIALLEVQSEVLGEKNLTFGNILQKIEMSKDINNYDTISISKYLIHSVCKLLHFSLNNIFNVIVYDNIPKNLKIISKEIVNELKLNNYLSIY